MATSSFDKRFVLDEPMLNAIIACMQATPVKEFNFNLNSTREQSEIIVKRILEKGIFYYDQR